MRWKLYWMLLLVAVALFPDTVPSVNAQQAIPRFEQTACKFDVPQETNVDCGYLVVPEDRTQSSNRLVSVGQGEVVQANTRTIRVFVARFHAKNPHPELAPIVFLDGGPGVHSLDWTVKTRPLEFVLQLAIDHELIMFDQRGTGHSEPALDCPEVAQFDYSVLDKNSQSRVIAQQYNAALRACHDRLIGQGINLAAYSTPASAADVNDLQHTLGYKTWNLYGVSYGTRLAQSMMSQFPQGIRSVVLDSTLVGLLGAPDFNRRSPFNVLFDGCAKSQTCNAAYPNLPAVFDHLVKQLNQQPVLVSIQHPFTGQPYELLLTGDELQSGLFWGLYSTRRIPILPKLIFDAYKGDYIGLAQLAFENNVVLSDEYISQGMNLSVNCLDQFSNGLCRQWLGNIPTPARSRTVTSNLPTLVLGGEYDPVTPPDYSKTVTNTLKNSVFFEFPGTGHEAAFSGQCPMNIVLAFLAEPTQHPDASCISTMHEPDFVVPIVVSF